MILAIRISGMVEISGEVSEALHRMRLRRKYCAVLIKPTPENMALITKVRNTIAYGDVDKETLQLLIEKRGVSADGKKVDAKKVVEGLDKSDLASLGLKPFFRLHPPRGGIDTKIHFGTKKGVLGDNKAKINELVRKML